MTDLKTVYEAYGGMTPFYQSARARYDLAELISDKPSPAALERLHWLRDMICVVEERIGVHLYRGEIMSAYQSRRLLGQMLAEMRDMLDQAKLPAHETDKPAHWRTGPLGGNGINTTALGTSTTPLPVAEGYKADEAKPRTVLQPERTSL